MLSSTCVHSDKRGATAEAAEPSRRSHSHDALHQAAVAWHQSLDVESRVATIPKRGTPAKKKQRSHCKTHSWHDWLQAAQLIGLISAQHSIESAASIGNPPFFLLLLLLPQKDRVDANPSVNQRDPRVSRIRSFDPTGRVLYSAVRRRRCHYHHHCLHGTYCTVPVCVSVGPIDRHSSVVGNKIV